MRDVAPGPGWWIASDGRWYPPELHPAVRATAPPATTAGGTTAQATTLSGMAVPLAPVGATPLHQHGAGGVTLPGPGPGIVLPPPVPPMGSIATGAGQGASLRMPRTGLAGFDDNPFAVSPRSMLPPPTKKRGRLTLPVIGLLVALAGAGAGTGVFLLVHPSPHRSPGAVAKDFYQHLEAGDYAAAAGDVDPSSQQMAASAGAVPAVAHVAQELTSLNLTDTATAPGPNGDVVVTVTGCGQSFSCGTAGPPVPVEQIDGQWYVDWGTWLAALQAGSS